VIIVISSALVPMNVTSLLAIVDGRAGRIRETSTRKVA